MIKFIESHIRSFIIILFLVYRGINKASGINRGCQRLKDRKRRLPIRVFQERKNVCTFSKNWKNFYFFHGVVGTGETIKKNKGFFREPISFQWASPLAGAKGDQSGQNGKGMGKGKKLKGRGFKKKKKKKKNPRMGGGGGGGGGKNLKKFFFFFFLVEIGLF